jgi:hypothetical protein
MVKTKTVNVVQNGFNVISLVKRRPIFREKTYHSTDVIQKCRNTGTILKDYNSLGKQSKPWTQNQGLLPNNTPNLFYRYTPTA